MFAQMVNQCSLLRLKFFGAMDEPTHNREKGDNPSEEGGQVPECSTHLEGGHLCGLFGWAHHCFQP